MNEEKLIKSPVLKKPVSSVSKDSRLSSPVFIIPMSDDPPLLYLVFSCCNPSG